MGKSYPLTFSNSKIRHGSKKFSTRTAVDLHSCKFRRFEHARARRRPRHMPCTMHPGFEAAACQLPCTMHRGFEATACPCSSHAHAACPCSSHAAAMPMLAAAGCCCWLLVAAGCCCWLLLLATGCCWLLVLLLRRLVESSKNLKKKKLINRKKKSVENFWRHAFSNRDRP